jgi:hypothetical protein
MTSKLDPTAWARTGDEDYDQKHKTVMPTEEQIADYAHREYSLPLYSARPFAAWLTGNGSTNEWASDEWEQFTDPDADLPLTVDQVISGAVIQWCGGRTR